MAKKRISNFDYTPTKEETTAMSLCNQYDIIVVPIPLDNYGNRIRLRLSKPGYRDLDGKMEFDGLKSDWVRKLYEIYINESKLLCKRRE